MENKENKSNKILLPVGTSSLITVFIVLCVAIFTTIMMVTAVREKKLSTQAYEHMKDYYAAMDTSSKLLNNINIALNSSKNIDEFEKNIDKSISDEDYQRYSLNIKSSNTNFNKLSVEVSFNVPISDNMKLSVIANNYINSGQLQVTQRKTTTKDELNLDDEFLNLYQGDDNEGEIN